MDIKIVLSSRDIYDWIVKKAKESHKTIDQFIEDAIWFYKNDIEKKEDPKRDRDKWRFK